MADNRNLNSSEDIYASLPNLVESYEGKIDVSLTSISDICGSCDPDFYKDETDINVSNSIFRSRKKGLFSSVPSICFSKDYESNRLEGSNTLKLDDSINSSITNKDFSSRINHNYDSITPIFHNDSEISSSLNEMSSNIYTSTDSLHLSVLISAKPEEESNPFKNINQQKQELNELHKDENINQQQLFPDKHYDDEEECVNNNINKPLPLPLPPPLPPPLPQQETVILPIFTVQKEQNTLQQTILNSSLLYQHSDVYPKQDSYIYYQQELNIESVKFIDGDINQHQGQSGYNNQPPLSPPPLSPPPLSPTPLEYGNDNQPPLSPPSISLLPASPPPPLQDTCYNQPPPPPPPPLQNNYYYQPPPPPPPPLQDNYYYQPPLSPPPPLLQPLDNCVIEPPPLPPIETYYNQPPPSLTPPSLSPPSSTSRRKRSTSNPRILPEIPLPPSIEDINLSDYDIKDDEYTKEEIYNYIKLSHEKVICNRCEKIIKKINSFGKPDGSYFICIPCSIKVIEDDDLKNHDWEISIKTTSNDKNKILNGNKTYPDIRFKRCARMAHYKPGYSYLERDKQQSKKNEKIIKNDYALKNETQCLYCRNFKKRYNLKNRLKKGESYESVTKFYYDELEY